MSRLITNKKTGAGVFSGPKGHTMLALDMEKGWVIVKTTTDEEEIVKYIGVKDENTVVQEVDTFLKD